jgi:hypothetical protein
MTLYDGRLLGLDGVVFKGIASELRSAGVIDEVLMGSELTDEELVGIKLHDRYRTNRRTGGYRTERYRTG